ncbi:MAG: XRE family transcriptional regulator [Sphingobacteriales bacterium]|nr:MAG: XRE family transcriptional regulator [Sphingobacteriales bacterium]
MQGSELRAIRKALSLSQHKFAEEIGMTRTWINLMESGKKPIERRTELAALYLALKGGEA